MNYGSIEREIHVEAAPEIVFDVVSNPEHVREWWTDEAEFSPEPGRAGRVGFGAPGDEQAWVQFTVVEAEPPRLFSFRWTHPEGEAAEPGNSFLVVFVLEPAAGGTRLRMTETGFRERGWDETKVAAEYADHVEGWGIFLPRLPIHAAKLAADS